MFQEFPDDNKNEDFLNEFRQKLADQSPNGFEEKKNELNRSKNVFVGAVSGVVLAGIVGWFVLSPQYGSGTAPEIPVIRRPQTAVKIQPSEPGGMEILNQDKTVYDIIDKKADGGQKVVENLLPPPETPQLPVITPEVPAPEMPAPVSSNAPQPPQEEVIARAEQIVKVVEKAPEPVAVKSEPVETTLPSIAEAAAKTPADEVKIPAKTEVKTAVAAPKAAPNGVWQVQLMSSPNKKAIEKSWSTLSNKYNVLSGVSYEIETADLGAKGIFYRLKAGAYADKTEADALCKEIKNMGGTCIVKKK